MEQAVLRELYESLDQRTRPEEIAQKIIQAENSDEDRVLLAALRQVCRHPAAAWQSSMLADFARPVGMERQLHRAQILFKTEEPPEGTDAGAIHGYLEAVSGQIARRVGQRNFCADRLNREQRQASGLGELSRRRYNKLFRLSLRMEEKLATFEAELEKREFTLVSKSRLASKLSWEEFSQDPNTACFLAYYVSRCNLRSEFTVSGQQKPYDTLSDALFQRCVRSSTTNWWAIAHAYPDQRVLAHLTQEQQGRLLGEWYEILVRIARLLRTTWERSRINRETMIVRKGNDSSTWNATAGAWNKARDGWIALLHALGNEEILERQCLGKVLRLMAADVAHWHRVIGGKLDPDTEVWAELPLPWEVLSGERECPRELVEAICQRHGVDSRKSGWVAPRPQGRIQQFRPTPELVHGVAITSPHLAKALRQAHWFSGKASHDSELKLETATEANQEIVVRRDSHGFAMEVGFEDADAQVASPRVDE